MSLHISQSKSIKRSTPIEENVKRVSRKAFIAGNRTKNTTNIDLNPDNIVGTFLFLLSFL